MKQTAVEWLIDQITLKKLGDNSLFLNPIIIGDLINQAKEMEKQQAHEYAEFAIRCDRKEMKILNFDGFINLKDEN